MSPPIRYIPVAAMAVAMAGAMGEDTAAIMEGMTLPAAVAMAAAVINSQTGKTVRQLMLTTQ
jgi:hypothetical protein